MNKLFTPVIHVEDINHAIIQGDKAIDAGSDGVWFIQHNGMSDITMQTALKFKNLNPDIYVGVNLLGESLESVGIIIYKSGLDGIWLDNAGVSSNGITDGAIKFKEKLFESEIQVFAGAAFKYQKAESDPIKAVEFVNQLGWIPCTSGDATGKAADVYKIRAMANASKKYLALASGIDILNVSDYLDSVTHYLVASSISENFTTLDFQKTYELNVKIKKA